MKEVFGDGASPIQDFVSLSLKTYRAALRWTDSILFMFCCLYGFHTQDAYSSFARTRVRYAVSLTLWLQPPSTRCKRPRVELAFLQMSSTCSFQLKLLEIVTPRYFVELTLDIGKPFKVWPKQNSRKLWWQDRSTSSFHGTQLSKCRERSEGHDIHSVWPETLSRDPWPNYYSSFPHLPRSPFHCVDIRILEQWLKSSKQKLTRDSLGWWRTLF